MRNYVGIAFALLFAAATPVSAATIEFLTDPFEGSTAPTDPGRQVVGNEAFIVFDIATDVFVFDPIAFGLSEISFANDVVGNLPATGINTVVLQTFDNDGDPATAFNAGIAANLIAAQFTSPGPGFFIYFNSGLDLARLVYSTDLSDNTADLKVLARMTNLAGQSGRDAFPTFTADNFDVNPVAVPEPASLSLMTVAGILSAYRARRNRRRSGNS